MNESIQIYRSQDGAHYFSFRFVRRAGYFDIYVLNHPGFNGQDTDPHKTHLFGDGRICIAAGAKPEDMQRALELSKNWAEYLLTYRISGIAQR